MSFCKCQQSHQSWYCVKICTKSCAEFLSAKHHQWCPQFVTWCDLWLKVLLIGSTASTTPRGSFSPTYKQTQSKSVWSHFIIQMNIQGVSAFYLIYSLTLTNIDKIWNCGFLLKLFFATMVSTNHGAAATLSKNKHSHFLEINQINNT